MKVLLVNPNYHCGGAEVPIGTMTPLGLLYVAGGLKQAGHAVELLDASRLDISDEEIGRRIANGGYDAVCAGSSASTASIKKALKVLEMAKGMDSSIHTLLGGVHPTFMFSELMDDAPFVDIIVRGEGEVTTLEALDALVRGEGLEAVNGVVWRRNREVMVNEARPPLDDLDAHRPAWELIEDWGGYRNGVLGEITAVVQFSRGCPFECSFCGQWQFWKEYRTRRPEAFVDELEMLNKENVTYFFMADENPVHNRAAWLEVLRDIARRELDIHIILNMRVTDVIRDRDELPLYKEAGVVHIDLGVEGTDQWFLDAVGKGTTVEENGLAISLLKENGIMSTVNLLVGEIGETEDSLRRKFRKMREWDPDLVLPYMVVPYPWTAFGAKHNGRLGDVDYQHWNYMRPTLAMEHMLPDRLVELVMDHTFAFHFRKYVQAVFLMRGRYRRRSIRRYISGAGVNYFFQRHRWLRPFIKLGMRNRRPLPSLYVHES